MRALPDNSPRPAALISRTAALLILLYQLRLLAADLTDTPFFITALAGAVISAIFLYEKKTRPFQAVIIIALVPWVIRFFISIPRFFIGDVSGAAIMLDSLLLNLDRNNFTALLPFYWTAASTYFSATNRLFLRADIITADAFFLVLFSIVPAGSMDAYRWPVLMIAVFALVLFLQGISLILSSPPEFKIRKKETAISIIFIFLLVFLGGVLFIRPFQEKAVEKGGGLLEPNLFRFDFSQFLRLESEISVNDDLVMIVRKEPDNFHILLRRYTLSAYSPKQGFFRHEEIDEASHPKDLPARHKQLPAIDIKNYSESGQEYYLVNFDSSAFIGMNMPVEVTPFETWDASSFNSAYSVKSLVSEAMPFELIDAVKGQPGPENLRLSAEEYAFYTEYGGDKEIAALSREIVFGEGGRGMPSYWEQIELIYDWLKFGEFRYSLKPGIARDGDQLKYFLFESKKGYCSYYAFAFTIMLRSLGIPCRVAAGFFVDTSTEVFNYYPVRTDMAHAWAEVWFPEYGWIEYDPTSQTVAEGEEYIFSQGTPPELFERLMKEILENRSKLKEKEGDETEKGKMSFSALIKKPYEFIKETGPFLGTAALVILFLAMRSGFLWLSALKKPPKKKAQYLWAHIKRRLNLAGLKKPLSSGEDEWAKEINNSIKGLYALYLDSAAARFAPVYESSSFRSMAEHYRLFKGEYRKAVPPARRLLAWIIPPLALLIKPSAKIMSILILFMLIFALRLDTAAQDTSQAPEQPSNGPDWYYNNALTAEEAENWEPAIRFYSEGAKAFPNDIRFPLSLGNLYYNRELYHLAWDEFRKAEKISPWLPDLLFMLAYTAGYLNMNDASAEYFERIITLAPDNRDAIGTLGWMYFKIHRLPEGEKLLLDAMSRLGEDADFTMTLGFIYSDMFRYDDAKNYYQKAIEKAESQGNRLFASLAHYNLSILESRFYHYDLAYESTGASLFAMNRASGRLANGELYLRRMELSRVLAEYQEAYGMDSSPLSKLNLAQAYLTGGRLEEARLYAEDCLKAKDNSWMLNYGIDPVRYKRDIHELLKNIYDGLLNAEAFETPPLLYAGTLKEKIQSGLRAVTYRFRREVHRHLYRKYSLLSANAYQGDSWISGDIHLDALIQYYNTFEPYPRRALNYLRKARSIEEPMIPGAVPAYNFEEARLRKDKKLLLQTTSDFDPLWERDMIADAYAELALNSKRAEKEDAAERLFAINRGALLQNRIRLPVNIRIDDSVKHLERVLRGAADAAGMDTTGRTSYRYMLSFSSGEEGLITCELYDGGRGIAAWKQNLLLPSSDRGHVSRREKAFFARSLKEGVFNAF